MQRPNGTGSIDRSARVRLIKRVIIGLIVSAILFPTLLCVLLFCRLEKLEGQLQKLTDTEETILAVSAENDMQLTRVGTKDNKESYITNEPETVSDNTLKEPEGYENSPVVDNFEANAVSINDAGVSANTTLDPTIANQDWPKKVYLTFDDGPSIHTDDILDILGSYGVKGNFFVVATDKPELKKMYKRIIDEGHVLGMHSYSHKYNEIYASRDSFINDVSKIQSLIYDETGFMPTIYRFPGGSSNKVAKLDMSTYVDVLAERGITFYDWNISSEDATTPAPDRDQIVMNSLNGIQNHEEAMILMHDLGNKNATVEALPLIIERLIEMGAQIAPIDENTMPIQHINIQ